MEKMCYLLLMVAFVSGCTKEIGRSNSHIEYEEINDFKTVGGGTAPIPADCLCWTDDCFVYRRTCGPTDYAGKDLLKKCIEEDVSFPYCIDDDSAKAKICRKIYDDYCS